jgi:2-polyprenyl-3-methyl-5-hydroxy-6-metoxy-1,4-benzoquinol methylase
VSRKYLVTRLQRCASCQLLYRSPTTSAQDSEEYYQNHYESGFTTELPSDGELKSLLDREFQGTPKNFDRYLKILGALGCGAGSRLFDFGCSWGYGSWQFQKRGFDVVGFEVSERRAAFARQYLGVDVRTRLNDISGSFDIFFSAHVLEHVPMLGDTLAYAFTRLKEGGTFISITPNGSLQFRNSKPESWRRFWGLKHPNLIDARFFEKAFRSRPYLLTSKLSGYEELENWSQKRLPTIGPLDGWELLAVCRNS